MQGITSAMTGCSKLIRFVILPTFFILFFSFCIQPSLLRAQDLPPQGGSFFDAMQEKMGLVYEGRPLPQEPHPFEVLLTRLSQHATLFASVIPFGRSLQKMAAYPDSLKFPRVVVATGETNKGLNTHVRGRLFIAYVEAAKKLEVISFNPTMGRFEFQIVDEFSPGGKARARYMPRTLCLRCHQAGGPIFPTGEWQETTAFNPELLKLAQAAIGRKEYFGVPLNRDDASSKHAAIAKPEHFEDMVRFGSLLVGYQKAWQTICSQSKEDISCRKKLVKWMLVTNLYDHITLEPDQELLDAFVAVLGQGTIDVPSEKLLDHNPIVRGQLSYHMPAEIDPSRPREPMQLIMPSKGDALGLRFYKFYIFVKSMGQSFFTEKDFAHLRALLGGNLERRSLVLTFDSQTYRPKKAFEDKVCLPDPNILLQGLNAQDRINLLSQVGCFSKTAWSPFTQAIDALPLKIEHALSRDMIWQELDKKMGTRYASTLCCQSKIDGRVLRNLEMKKVLDPVSIRDERLKSFVKFCSECHLYQDLPPPFLAGESEQEILNNLRNRASLIRFRLQNEQMPPHFARHPLTSNERLRLLYDLQKILE